jgi:hypothetical protein
MTTKMAVFMGWKAGRSRLDSTAHDAWHGGEKGDGHGVDVPLQQVRGGDIPQIVLVGSAPFIVEHM